MFIRNVIIAITRCILQFVNYIINVNFVNGNKVERSVGFVMLRYFWERGLKNFQGG